MLWTKLGTSVRAMLHQPEDLQQLSIVYCRVQPLHPFHVQRVHSLQPDDPHDVSRLHSGFLTKLRQTCTLPVPCCSVMKQPFSREGAFNTHNAHMWALNNPHSTRPRAMQQRFTVNVWAGIVGGSLLGPYILPPRLDSHKYLVFLQDVLPELLTDVPPTIRCRMWFQQGRERHLIMQDMYVSI
ncbi:uncharacterized protein TNCV_2550521 [Trichonephila clavipes]|nr:uncharacterized protein TNCV_2550521 [Trichonephila clavipes]